MIRNDRATRHKGTAHLIATPGFKVLQTLGRNRWLDAHCMHIVSYFQPAGFSAARLPRYAWTTATTSSVLKGFVR